MQKTMIRTIYINTHTYYIYIHTYYIYAHIYKRVTASQQKLSLKNLSKVTQKSLKNDCQKLFWEPFFLLS